MSNYKKLLTNDFKDAFDQAMDEWNIEFNKFQIEVYKEFDKEFVQACLDQDSIYDLRNILINDRKAYFLRMSYYNTQKSGKVK